MASLRDWHVAIVDSAQDPITVGNPFPVTGTVTGTVTTAPQSGTFTDRSGTITLGGTAQQVAAANSSRKYFLFQNVSAETLWINFGTTAVANQPSIKIPVDAGFVLEGLFINTALISVIGATTGSAFVAKEG